VRWERASRPSANEAIFVGVEPIDLRWGFDTLAGIVTERIGRAPRSGALFVFFGKRRAAIKILFADASGLCLFHKRLDRGTFKLPLVHEPAVSDSLTDSAHVSASSFRAKRKTTASSGSTGAAPSGTSARPGRPRLDFDRRQYSPGVADQGIPRDFSAGRTRLVARAGSLTRLVTPRAPPWRKPVCRRQARSITSTIVQLK
jgi:transposase